VNALKQMETVITKQIAKQKRRDKSQFTSQLMTLDNSGAEKQQHHILLHHMVLMGVTNFCSQEGGGERGGGCEGAYQKGVSAKHKACAVLLPVRGLQRGTTRWQWPHPPYARHTG